MTGPKAPLRDIIGIASGNTSITKLEITRDGNGFISEVKYYQDADLIFTLSITRNGSNQITAIERT